MKNLIFISYILIILFKTGNVLSNNNIFNVNNIAISKETYKNQENLVNQAFKKGFDELIKRLLLEDDYKDLSLISLNEIKKLVSYYQIVDDKQKNNITNVNIFFNKNKIHNFFYKKNILYSDIINTKVILFPLFIQNSQINIYSNNFFYKNWKDNDPNNLIEYTLPIDSIENIEIINSNKDNIYNINVKEFFKEYDVDNMVFLIIEMNKQSAKVFLNTNISGKKINKSVTFKNENLDKENFYRKIILELKKTIPNLIKSQNLIDVRTPSFLNIKLILNKKNDLVEFKKKKNKINLVNNIYIQEMNKNYALVKIKYLGKITKIIKKLKKQNINLKNNNGQWQLNLIQ